MPKILLSLILALLLSTPVLAERIDINTADAQTLEENLQGIGPAKAQAIIQYRKKNGDFKSLEDLKAVPGIGDATLEKNREKIAFGGGNAKPQKEKSSSDNQPTKK
jgi:competence protein ComEA